MHRRAKIVATLGPASDRAGAIEGLVDAGIDVARVNLAHGTADEHERRVTAVRSAARERGRTIGVLADLPGPKIRTGRIRSGEVALAAGASLVLTTERVDGDAEHVSTTFQGLPGCVSSGDAIYLADGAIVLEVTDVAAPEIRTKVVRGGTLRSGKGMHVPSAEDQFDPLGPADRDALTTVAVLDADFIGTSFIRTPADVASVRAALPDQQRNPLLVAKIETASAVDNLDSIVRAADAVMVARGDLGIQLPLERVPEIQKRVIAACNSAAKPVIVATQMLESMTRSSRPTRAEVSDVANAVLDGTDAVMLSEETAIGDDPALVVRTMNDIVMAAEASGRDARPSPTVEEQPISWALARAAARIADDVHVAGIICPTRTGSTARRVAAFRPRAPIIGPMLDGARAGELSLTWGVIPLALPHGDPHADLARNAVDAALEAGALERGALAVVVAGSPAADAGSTDVIQVLRA